MFFKYSLAAAVVLVAASVVAAEEAIEGAVFTIPIDFHNLPDNRNQISATKRYLHKRQAVSDVSLTSIIGDVLYSVPITLGTPPQKFNLAIDTGSFVTWVVSSNCVTGACANITNHFNPSLSTTASVTPTPFQTKYVSGDRVEGQYMTEQYSIGDLNFEAIAGLVSVNQATLPPSVDGIMGLWSAKAELEQISGDIPILKILSRKKYLSKNQIGVFLQANDPVSRDSNRANAPGGEISFGGANAARYKEPITYINCVGRTPWMLSVTAMSVGGKPILTGGAQATIDTGTSLMVVPQLVADAIHAAIPGSFKSTEYGWFVPCDGTIPITITFGNFVTTIPYKSFAIQDNYAKLNDGRTLCLSSVMYLKGTDAIADWLLGAVFMKNMYTIFDFDPAVPGGRIGFAQLAVGGNAGTGSGAVGGNAGTGGGAVGGNAGTGSGAVGQFSSVRVLQALTFVVAGAFGALLL
ncbi:MAG: aspartic peptidase domain-containing protein [Linnemannia gamsii]|nr:MAG: aspartic peptidase domain-containing protein [Linnemannia gamsii]